MASSVKFIIPLGFWVVFIFMVLNIPYPQTLSQAKLIQLLGFFLPLYFALLFTLNIMIERILISLSISLGLVFLLTLKALDSLNLVTGILTLVFVYLLVSYFRKNKGGGLTKLPKISKLTTLRRKP